MTEKQKMLAGLPYNATDPELLLELNHLTVVRHRSAALSPYRQK